MIKNTVLSLFIFLTSWLFTVNAMASDGIRQDILLKSTTSWDGTTYESYPQGQPELSIAKVTIPPHSVLAWHTHPMPNAGYVLSGVLTVEKKTDGSKKTLKAGDTVPETVGTVHRGYTGDQEAVILVFYAGVRGQPLSQKVK